MDAHENEAAAAAAGMADLYGSTKPEHAVGDVIWFRLADQVYPQTGRVQSINSGGWMRVSVEGGDTVLVSPDDVVKP